MQNSKSKKKMLYNKKHIYNTNITNRQHTYNRNPANDRCLLPKTCFYVLLANMSRDVCIGQLPNYHLTTAYTDMFFLHVPLHSYPDFVRNVSWIKQMLAWKSFAMWHFKIMRIHKHTILVWQCVTTDWLRQHDDLSQVQIQVYPVRKTLDKLFTFLSCYMNVRHLT